MRGGLGCIIAGTILSATLCVGGAIPARAQEPGPLPRSEAMPEAPAAAGSGALPEPAPVVPAPDSAAPPPKTAAEPPSAGTATTVCLLIESAAQAHGLPFEFFARLIWQESRFQPNAVGPMTRNGQRAQGIAQFMPGTAAERGLFDPFDPVAALPKAAEFLAELQAQFGNLGLAAAAYNAGPRRVRDWLAGRATLPAETRNYVLTITGHSADDWAAANRGGDVAPTRRTSCGELMAMLKEQPSIFVGELQRRVREGAARPWGVELTAGFQRDRVLAAYASLEKTYRAILDKHDLIIIESKFRSRGTQPFYQVRIGADSRSGADTLCAALRKAGGPCLVMRNWVGRANPLGG
jgi:Transglycosylase SLT domain/SPOR domain